MSTARKKKEEEEYVDVSPEELAAIDEGIAALDRGEWVDGDEFLRELRERLDRE